jgi:hypothetical protein
MRRIILACALAGILGVPAFGQQAVNPEGIYQLNFAKSIIRGPTGKSATLNYTPDGFTGIGFDADGKPTTSTVTIIADGKPHPVTGAPHDMATYTQIDPYTISINRTKAGKVVETGVRIVNPDGKAVWVTLIGTTPAGQSYSHVLVYEKQ